MTSQEWETVEYALDVLCYEHDEAIRIAQIYYTPNLKGATGFLRWRAAVLPENPTKESPLQTFYGLVAQGEIETELVSDRGTEMEGTRWRFECSQCIGPRGRPKYWTRSGSKIEPVFEKLKEANIRAIGVLRLVDLA